MRTKHKHEHLTPTPLILRMAKRKHIWPMMAYLESKPTSMYNSRGALHPPICSTNSLPICTPMNCSEDV